MRYLKNMQAFSKEENELFRNKSVAVIGCGGLGGYIIEMLARLGIGNITVVDGDVFNETNLNRQLYSSLNVIGKNKALIAKNRIIKINPDINVCCFKKMLNEKNAKIILEKVDLVIDALDNLEGRFLIQQKAKKFQIAFIHGAVSGWYGQVSTILPGDDSLYRIYPEGINTKINDFLGNPSFMPTMIAAIQVAEAAKVLTNKGHILRNELALIDLLEQTYTVLDI